MRTIALVTLGLALALDASACSSSSKDNPSTGPGNAAAYGGGLSGGDDSGGSCSYVTQPIDPNEATDAGIIPAQLGAMAAGTHYAALAWDPQPSTEFEVTPTGSTTLTISVTLVDTGWTDAVSTGVLCGPGTLSVPAMVHVTTADGGLDETFQVTLSSTASNDFTGSTDASLTFTQPLTQVAGTFRVTDTDGMMWDSTATSLTATFTAAGVSGSISYTTMVTIATGNPNTAAGGGALFTPARWTPLAADAAIPDTGSGASTDASIPDATGDAL